MTGPEHYREAERLTMAVTKPGAILPQSRVLDHGDHGDVIALAQVHATLALAAATALGREGEGRTQPGKDRAAWFDAAAECRKAATA
jgi:hypothetical protein